jgi:thiamine pyrophosphate-dependent acetolactate synthase large subunit-like protein
LDFIGIGHEGAVFFAASAFAQLSGAPAACLPMALPAMLEVITNPELI